MSGSWEAMLDDERRQRDLARRRDLARLSKVELIDLVLTTEHEVRQERERADEAESVRGERALALVTALAALSRAEGTGQPTNHEVERREQ